MKNKENNNLEWLQSYTFDPRFYESFKKHVHRQFYILNKYPKVHKLEGPIAELIKDHLFDTRDENSIL